MTVKVGDGGKGFINVGKTLVDGVTPVGREVEALYDLAETGRPTYFVPLEGPLRFSDASTAPAVEA